MSYRVVSYITDKLDEPFLYFGRPDLAPDACKIADASAAGSEKDQIGTAFPDHEMTLDGITHINYGFVFLRNDGLYIRRPECLRYMSRICKEKGIKLLCSLQQWGGQKFDERSRSEALRRKNARMVREIVDEYELDGVDVDWEYPGLNLGKNEPIQDFKDEYYIQFMQALRDELPDKLLTIAHGCETRHWIHTDFAALHPLLDFINLMGYDFNWSFLGEAHHSNLYPGSCGKGSEAYSVDRAVKHYMSLGVPAEKIHIGVPYYGYVAGGGPEGFLRFDQIEALLRDDPRYARQFDEKAGQSYVTKDGAFEIAYDDERTLTLKCDYIKANGLGGLMNWTYNHDPLGQARQIVKKQLLEGSGTGGDR
ncbi:MAG: hypothetical protein J6P72_00290 [Firmicutes bacterium]|nr:hypothetical protein [Bacillota bacterium]